jgi:two-component system sensor histidine kinase PilS (NtrC family)
VLLVSLAAAGLITRGRLAYFHAATAALAVLLEQTFQLWRNDAGPQEFLQAGITAGAFFATAGPGFRARPLRAHQRADCRRAGVDLANLSQINEIVIRDMQDGILVVDGDGRIRQNNPRATQLLGPLAAGAGRRSRTTRRDRALLDGWRKGSETTFMQLRTPRAAASCRCTSCPSAAAIPRPRGVRRGRGPHARAGAADEARGAGRLTASIAHEIRNPLSSIGHAAELSTRTAPWRSATSGCCRSSAATCSLDRIVQEVLYLNRRDRAQPERSSRAVLADFAHEFATARGARGGIDVQVRTTQRLLFDRQHLDQVLWNIVRNAWRTAASSRARCASWCGPAAPGRCSIDVLDDGPGVPREAQRTSSSRSSPPTRRARARASTSRASCARATARARIRREPGGGSSASPLKASLMNRKAVLIVDDEADIRELLVLTLSRMGVDADTRPSSRRRRRR